MEDGAGGGRPVAARAFRGGGPCRARPAPEGHARAAAGHRGERPIVGMGIPGAVCDTRAGVDLAAMRYPRRTRLARMEPSAWSTPDRVTARPAVASARATAVPLTVTQVVDASTATVVVL